MEKRLLLIPKNSASGNAQGGKAGGGREEQCSWGLNSSFKLAWTQQGRVRSKGKEADRIPVLKGTGMRNV